MNGKAKHADEQKAAGEVADSILDSLEQFSPAERKIRLRDIHRLLRTDSSTTKRTSKRSSKAPTPRRSQRVAASR